MVVTRFVIFEIQGVQASKCICFFSSYLINNQFIVMNAFRTLMCLFSFKLLMWEFCDRKDSAWSLDSCFMFLLVCRKKAKVYILVGKKSLYTISTQPQRIVGYDATKQLVQTRVWLNLPKWYFMPSIATRENFPFVYCISCKTDKEKVRFWNFFTS